MEPRTALILLHIIGTVLGTGGATFAEVFMIKSLRDGILDPTENSFLKTTFTMLRVGMILIILSGFGLFLLTRLTGEPHHLYSPRMWAKLTITLLILINALLLQVKRIPFWLGSAISLTSWYATIVIGAWRVRADYLTLMLWYAGGVAAVAVILHLIKRMFKVH